MVSVYRRVFVGDQTVCRPGTRDLVVVHACKMPCHQRAVGYRGTLPKTHPLYLVLRCENDLYLNLIDAPEPLFELESFNQFLSFAADRHRRGSSILIHCNQGKSRGPSLALIFLAKHLKVIPADTYAAARRAFDLLYRSYQPGAGIQRFLLEHWAAF